MNCAQPTRLVSRLAAPAIAAVLACGRAEPPSALAATKPAEQAAAPASAPAPSAVPVPSTSAAPAAPPAASAPAHPITSVLVLGDSLTDEKVGGGGFVRILREHCPKVPFDNRAKGGFMVNQIRKRFET